MQNFRLDSENAVGRVPPRLERLANIRAWAEFRNFYPSLRDIASAWRVSPALRMFAGHILGIQI